MNKEKYAKFIAGVDLSQIYLSELTCHRAGSLDGDQWTVAVKPNFEVVSSTNLSITVRAAFEVQVKNEDEPMVSITTAFMLDYSYDEETTFDEEIAELFLQSNPALNIWPYAREIISSLTTRMGLPALVIEPYKVLR